MKVSLNTVKELTGIELPAVDELAARVNSQLGGVEEIIDLGEKYKNALIVAVAKCEKHPNADKLSVCLIYDNGAVPGVERDEDGLVQVVCGAPNVRGGMMAIWLPPGATVPASYDDAEPFVLGTRELRGVMSNGMLAAADELAIGTDHEGIVELTEDDMPVNIEVNDDLLGRSFAEVFGLNDTIFDIENKMFTHRPDCFGQLGVAREISAILRGVPSESEDVADTRFVNPDWYWQHPEFTSASSLALEVANEAPEKVPRFMAVAMNNIEVKPSPMWLQTTLVRWGAKPINNVVDITNYIMLLTAQPTHAYDYDKLRGHKIGARMARDGEQIPLLNGKDYTLTPDDIVIADGEGAIGLAGIMGGGNSEVSNETKSIVLEVATFDMYTLRRSSMRHGVFTDALTRFNKGQSRLQNSRVLSRSMELFTQLCGGAQASGVFDLPDKAGEPQEDSLNGEIALNIEFVNSVLGSKLTAEQIGGLLRRVNFASYPDENDANILRITAPYWRTDIEIPEDVVEEVGRLYGFDKLPRELPMRSMNPAPKNALREAKMQLRTALEKLGANEVLTYSFVHERVIKNAGQHVEKAFKLSNALSPDLQYYRLSVLPSLLDKVHMNIKAGHDEFVLYEVGKGHEKGLVDDDGLPREMTMLDAVYASKKPREGAPYYHMSELVRQLFGELKCKFELAPIEASDSESAAPFELSRSAAIKSSDGTILGMVGELKQEVLRAFKLPEYAAALTLDVEKLHTILAASHNPYYPLSKFPSVTQDISMQVEANMPYSAVFDAAQVAVRDNSDVRVTLAPVSVYQSKNIPEKKTITLRVTTTSDKRTLTDKDAAGVLEAIENAVDAL